MRSPSPRIGVPGHSTARCVHKLATPVPPLHLLNSSSTDSYSHIRAFAHSHIRTKEVVPAGDGTKGVVPAGDGGDLPLGQGPAGGSGPGPSLESEVGSEGGGSDRGRR